MIPRCIIRHLPSDAPMHQLTSPLQFQPLGMQTQCNLSVIELFVFSLLEYDPEPGEVTMDSWVGRIESINEDFRLSFPDGAVCVLTDADISLLEDAEEKREKVKCVCENNKMVIYETQDFK